MSNSISNSTEGLNNDQVKCFIIKDNTQSASDTSSLLSNTMRQRLLNIKRHKNSHKIDLNSHESRLKDKNIREDKGNYEKIKEIDKINSMNSNSLGSYQSYNINTLNTLNTIPIINTINNLPPVSNQQNLIQIQYNINNLNQIHDSSSKIKSSCLNCKSTLTSNILIFHCCDIIFCKECLIKEYNSLKHIFNSITFTTCNFCFEASSLCGFCLLKDSKSNMLQCDFIQCKKYFHKECSFFWHVLSKSSFKIEVTLEKVQRIFTKIHMTMLPFIVTIKKNEIFNSLIRNVNDINSNDYYLEEWDLYLKRIYFLNTYEIYISLIRSIRYYFFKYTINKQNFCQEHSFLSSNDNNLPFFTVENQNLGLHFFNSKNFRQVYSLLFQRICLLITSNASLTSLIFKYNSKEKEKEKEVDKEDKEDLLRINDDDSIITYKIQTEETSLSLNKKNLFQSNKLNILISENDISNLRLSYEYIFQNKILKNSFNSKHKNDIDKCSCFDDIVKLYFSLNKISSRSIYLFKNQKESLSLSSDFLNLISSHGGLCGDCCNNKNTFNECNDQICSVPSFLTSLCQNRNLYTNISSYIRLGITKSESQIYINQDYPLVCYPICSDDYLEIISTKGCGYGLRSLRFINRNEIIIEYLGELIDENLLWKKVVSKNQDEIRYVMKLRKDYYIDSRYYGNKARFINHSCNPNSEVQVWTTDDRFRGFIVAIRDILPGEEISYDYKFSFFKKNSFLKCMCGEENCRGTMGYERKGE